MNFLEPLEPRIAPAGIFTPSASSEVAGLHDVDGLDLLSNDGHTIIVIRDSSPTTPIITNGNNGVTFTLSGAHIDGPLSNGVVKLSGKPAKAPKAAFDGFEISPDGRTARYLDADGDLVTVKTSRGTFDDSNFIFDGEDLDQLHLADPEFSDANITITVRKGRGTDGLSIERINAEGVDLGKVRIAGNLVAIDAGDEDTTDISLAGLTAKSFGFQGTTSKTRTSIIQGSVGPISIAGDFSHAYLGADSPYGVEASFSTVKIAGNFIESTLSGTGTLGSFSSGDFSGGLGFATPAESTKLSFKKIGDDSYFEIAGTIKSFKATHIEYADIYADRIETLTVTGDKKAGLDGGFRGRLVLGDKNHLTDLPSLGKATFAGHVDSARFRIAGSVDSFSAGAMSDTRLYVGFNPYSDTQPLIDGVFYGSTLGSFKITGKSAIFEDDSSFASSYVIATHIGAVSVHSVSETISGGAFGYEESIGKVHVKTPAYSYDPATDTSSGARPFSIKQMT